MSSIDTKKFLVGAMGLQPKSVTGPCAAGIDQKFGKFSLSICDVVRTTLVEIPVPRLVFYGNLYDDLELLEVMARYKVICAVGDARPDATTMYRVQKAAQKRHITFWRVQYNGNPSNVELQKNEKEQLLTLERTLTLDNLLYAINTAQGIALPQNFRDICAERPGADGGFVKEMCAAVRVPIVWKGEGGARWEEGGASDDSMHSLNYCLIAAKLGKLNLPRGNMLMAGRGIVKGLMNDRDDDDIDMPLWQEGQPSYGGVVLEA